MPRPNGTFILPVLHAASFFRDASLSFTGVEDWQKAVRIQREGPTIIHPPFEEWQWKPTIDDVERWLANISANGGTDPGPFSFDFEATLMREVVCLALWSCHNPTSSRGICIPILSQGGVRYWDPSSERRVMDLLRGFFTNPEIKKVAQNGTGYDCGYPPFNEHSLLKQAWNIDIQGYVDDSLSSHHMIFSELRHGLATQASIVTDLPPYKDQLWDQDTEVDEEDDGAADWARVLDIPDKKLRTYCGGDSFSGAVARNTNRRIMQELGCEALHDTLSLPLVPIVQSIGLRGIPIDMERRELLLQDLAIRVMGIDNSLESYGIRNANSDRQLGEQLKAMGVPLTERTEKNTQWKVDAEVLGRANWNCNTRRIDVGKQPLFPFLPQLIKRSRLVKASENIRALGVCDDGLLRTALKACHTRTARYASSGFGRKGKVGWCQVCRCWGEHGTNLQNISRGCVLCGSSARLCTCEGGGVHVKQLFTATPGWCLGEWDYAALELRIMAYRIRSEKLISRLEGGVDLHTLHAQLMFPGLDITKRRRTLAKNFIYAVRGAGGNRAVQIVLAKQGEYIGLDEIEGWRQAIFAEYPEIPEWINRTDGMLALQQSRSERRLVYNAFGRPRVLLGNAPLKEALANEISATAADIMSFVALRLAYEQPEVMQRVCMQIHDSFLVHAPEREFDHVMNTVKEYMERAVWGWDRFMVYPAEAKAGERWSDLVDWPEAA